MKNFYINTVHLNSIHIKRTFAVKVSSLKAILTQGLGNVAVILLISIFLQSGSLQAQNCPVSGTHIQITSENTYYPGTQATVSVGATSIMLGPIGAGANFGITPIAIGDVVLIIQMQGATINVPASKTNAVYGANIAGLGAGMLAANLQAGKMEFAVATNAVPVIGGTLNIATGLTNAYSYAAYGATGQYKYQVIRVPQFFNIQITAPITTPFWNGSTGGVTVISAVSQLDFNGQTVDASGAGFRGGGGRALSGAAGTNKNDFYSMSTLDAHASKAEGIAGTPRFIYDNGALVDNGVVNEGYPGGSYARGAPGNAGGGASDTDPISNDQNAGGGGGGNGGAGGVGGNGWFSFGFTGGRGGTAFQTYGPATFYYSPSRLIMGGGGGAGSNNDGTGIPGGGVASGGATGGGMIIVNATTFFGVGNLIANGLTGNSTVVIDGSGGGGAGGSILIFANSGHAGITATAKGGDGGSNFPAGVSATQHGPGGGGGGGVIYSNAAINVASSVSQGFAGISNGTSATNSYGAANGVAGVLTQTFPFAQLPPKMQICQSIVLPVTILSFNANYASANNVKVEWSTTNEINADYFEVERSLDAIHFIGVVQVNASQSLNPIHTYSINDQLFNINSNIVYYRLRIVDQSGKFSYSKVVPVKLDQPESVLSVYPNPLDNYTILNIFSNNRSEGLLRLIDNSGKQILTKSFNVSNGNNSIMVDQLGNLPRGIYVIQVMMNNKLYNQKIVKR